jgi:ankyrin repeat protein
MIATKQKYSDLVQALLDKNIDLAKALIAQSADPNEAGPAFNQGGTVLHLALLYGESEIIEMLVEKGANVDALNKDGETPLIYAIRHNNTQAGALFIEKGAALDRKSNEGYTAMDYARFNRRTEILELLTAVIEQRRQQEEEKYLHQRMIDETHKTAATRQSILKRRNPKITMMGL